MNEKPSKHNPTPQEKNRLHLWRNTLINLLARIQVFKNLAPLSEKLFEELPDAPKVIDPNILQNVLNTHIPLVCVEESCILGYYSIFDKSGKGGSNIAKNSTKYIQDVQKELLAMVNSSEEFKNLHKKIKLLRNEILAHQSGQSFKINQETRKEGECFSLNKNRFTEFLLNQDEFEIFEHICSKIYGYIIYDDPLKISWNRLEDMIFGFEPIK